MAWLISACMYCSSPFPAHKPRLVIFQSGGVQLKLGNNHGKVIRRFLIFLSVRLAVCVTAGLFNPCAVKASGS
jgi:hypothetical protein